MWPEVQELTKRLVCWQRIAAYSVLSHLLQMASRVAMCQEQRIFEAGDRDRAGCSNISRRLWRIIDAVVAIGMPRNWRSHTLRRNHHCNAHLQSQRMHVLSFLCCKRCSAGVASMT